MIIFTLTVLCVMFWMCMVVWGAMDFFKLIKWLFRMFDRLIITPLAWCIVAPFRGLTVLARKR